jgi:hypothetical protein
MTDGVFFDNGQEWLMLVDPEGSVLNAAGLTDTQIQSTNWITNGLSETGYVIRAGDRASRLSNITEVSSPSELGELILELQEAGNLPLILGVNAANYPFSRTLGGDAIGGHVINVHPGYNPETGLVPFTNQWGKEHDYLGKGFPIDKLFEAMKEPRQ